MADALYYPDVFATRDPADGRESVSKRYQALMIAVLPDSTGPAPSSPTTGRSTPCPSTSSASPRAGAPRGVPRSRLVDNGHRRNPTPAGILPR